MADPVWLTVAVLLEPLEPVEVFELPLLVEPDDVDDEPLEDELELLLVLEPVDPLVVAELPALTPVLAGEVAAALGAALTSVVVVEVAVFPVLSTVGSTLPVAVVWVAVALAMPAW